MKKSIIIACSMLLAVSCNLFDKDDDNDNNDPPTPPGAAEVAIADVTAPDEAISGTVATIVATVENTSDVAVTDNFSVILSNQTREVDLDTVLVDGLAANSNTEVSFEWNTTDAETGENTLAVRHTYNDDNANNDEVTSVVTITESDGPLLDFGITEVTAVDTAALGTIVDIEVMVENLGDTLIPDDITLTLTNNASSEVIATEVINGSETGVQANVTFSWNTEGATAGDYTLTVAHDYVDDNATNDSVDIQIYLTEEEVDAVVDLAIAEVNAPETVTAGEAAAIEVVVANAGDESVADDITLTLSDDAGNELASEVINGVEAGADATVNFDWATTDLAAGDYELIVSFAFVDDDETNNEQTVTITVEDADDPVANVDLSIVSVETPDNTVTEGVIYATTGDTVFVEVTIENLGPDDLTEDIPVILYHHAIDEGSATIAGGLASGASETVTILWLTQDQSTGAPPHPIDVTIEYTDADETNNVQTIFAQVDPPADDA